MARFLNWLSGLSLSRIVGAILGNSADLRAQLADRDATIAKLEAALDEERMDRRRWQDLWLQRQGVTAIYNPAPSTPYTPPSPSTMSPEDILELDRVAEIEEKAQRAAVDADFLAYVERAAEYDEQWAPVLARALEMGGR